MKIWREKDKDLNTWVWKADFTYKKKRKRPWAYSKADLEELIKEIRSAPTQKRSKITIAELAGEHTQDFDLDVEYYRRGKVVLDMFLESVGNSLPVLDLATSDIKSFVRVRRSRNLKLQNSSINKDLTYISKMLSSAHEYFKELKDYNAPKVPWQAESTKANQRVIYPEESETLLNFLRDPEMHPGEKPDSPKIRGDYADMYELAMNTAMRWGEVAQIEWSMVNLPAREIVLPKKITKTDEPRVIPLNSRMVEILSRRSRETIWVFPRADGKSYRKYYADRLGSICKKLGLPFGREAGFTLHSSRHTVITTLVENGEDIAAIQQLSGHSDRTMALRYTHGNKKRLRAAVEKLSQNGSYSTGRPSESRHEKSGVVVNIRKKAG